MSDESRLYSKESLSVRLSVLLTMMTVLTQIDVYWHLRFRRSFVPHLFSFRRIFELRDFERPIQPRPFLTSHLDGQGTQAFQQYVRCEDCFDCEFVVTSWEILSAAGWNGCGVVLGLTYP